MGIRYVGDKPSRMDRHTKHKNTKRWMYVPKQKDELPCDAKYWLGVIGLTIVCSALLVFTWLAVG